VDGWYVCFAALSSNVSDTASRSARARRKLFLGDNDNNHQNFKVSCNSDAAMKRLTKDEEANPFAGRSVRPAFWSLSASLRQGLF
jgi:hypothetical protein